MAETLPHWIKRTGVFASADDVTLLKSPILLAWVAGVEPQTPAERVHEFAVGKYGLPEIVGNYGLDTSNGEFLVPDYRALEAASTKAARG